MEIASPPFPRFRLLLSVLLALLVFSACEVLDKESGSRDTPMPLIEGNWSGTMTVEAASSPLSMNLTQVNRDVTGTYEGPNGLTGRGSVEGLTTGQSFFLRLIPEEPAVCEANIEISGLNDGASLSATFSGDDCAGGALRGDAWLSR